MAKNKTTKLDPRTVRADGRGMTKGQRAARERALCEAILAAMTAMSSDLALEHGNKADALKKGLSAASVNRARVRAGKIADEFPPGFLEAVRAVDTFEQICADHGVGGGDLDSLWEAVSLICMHQLAAQHGPFHKSATAFGLTRPATVESYLRDFVERDLAARDNNAVCDCPNCRPRRPEELN